MNPFRDARTASNVKRIYRREALKTHPDKHPRAATKDVHARKFRKLASSYEKAMHRVTDPHYMALEEERRRQEEIARKAQYELNLRAAVTMARKLRLE